MCKQTLHWDVEICPMIEVRHALDVPWRYACHRVNLEVPGKERKLETLPHYLLLAVLAAVPSRAADAVSDIIRYVSGPVITGCSQPQACVIMLLGVSKTDDRPVVLSAGRIPLVVVHQILHRNPNDVALS